MDNTSGGDLSGNHWNCHGKHLSGKTVTCEKNESGGIVNIHCDDINLRANDQDIPAREKRIKGALGNKRHYLFGKKILKVAAERDILAEPANGDLSLAVNGQGATNIIKKLY